MWECCQQLPLAALMPHIDKINWCSVVYNPNLTFDFVERYAAELLNNCSGLIRNPSIVSRRTDAAGIHFTIQSTPPFVVSFWADKTISNVDRASQIVFVLSVAITNLDWCGLTRTADWSDIERYPDLPWDSVQLVYKIPTLAAAQNWEGQPLNRRLLNTGLIGSQIVDPLNPACNPRVDWRVIARNPITSDILSTLVTRDRYLIRRINANELLAAYIRRWRRARVLPAITDLLIPDLAAICAEYVTGFDPTQVPVLA